MAGDLAASCRRSTRSTKALVVHAIGLHDSITIVPGLLDLTHVRNSGAAFGFLNAADFPGKPVVIAIVALLALVGVGAYAMHAAGDRTGLRGSA